MFSFNWSSLHPRTFPAEASGRQAMHPTVGDAGRPQYDAAEVAQARTAALTAAHAAAAAATAARDAGPTAPTSPRRSPRRLPPRQLARLAPAHQRVGAEVWLTILRYAELNPLQLHHLGRASRQLHGVCQDNALWYGTDADEAALAARRADHPNAVRGNELAVAARLRLNGLSPSKRKLVRDFCRQQADFDGRQHADNRRWTIHARKSFDICVLAARYNLFHPEELLGRITPARITAGWTPPQQAVVRQMLSHGDYNFFFALPEQLRESPKIASAALRQSAFNVASLPSALDNDPAVLSSLFVTHDVWRALVVTHIARPNLFGQPAFHKALRSACAELRYAPLTTSFEMDEAVEAAAAALPAEVLACRHVAHRLVTCRPRFYPNLPAALREDRDFALCAVRDGVSLLHLSEALRDDVEVVAAAIARTPRDFAYAGPTCRNDVGLAWQLLAASPCDVLPFCVLGPRPLGDVAWMREALAYHPALIEKGGAHVRSDATAAYHVACTGQVPFLAHFTQALRNDRRAAAAILQVAPAALCFMGQRIRRDAGLVAACVERDGTLLRFADESLRENRDIVQRAIGQNGLALGFAGAQLRADTLLSRMAVRNNLDAVRVACMAVCDDEAFLVELGIGQRPDLWSHLSYSLRCDLLREESRSYAPALTLPWRN